MFSGAGEFFRPVELRRDLPPIAQPQPVKKTGDEDPREREAFQRRLSDIVDEADLSATDGDTAGAGEDVPFGEDFIELSLMALQATLAGDKTAHAYGRPPVQAAPDIEPALAAYRRAATTVQVQADAPDDGASVTRLAGARPETNDEWRAAAAHHPDADAGSEIFYMLAALERAGVTSVTVKDRQTIYAALRRRCLDLAIPLAPPPPPARD